MPLDSCTGSEDFIPPQGDQIEHGRAAAVPMVEMVAGVDLSSDRKTVGEQVCAERRSPCGHRGSTLGIPTAVPV